MVISGILKGIYLYLCVLINKIKRNHICNGWQLPFLRLLLRQEKFVKYFADCESEIKIKIRDK